MYTVGMSQSLDVLLTDLYYNLENSTAFSSVPVLYRAAKKKQKDVTISKVKNWYISQDTPTLWYQSSGNPKRNPVIQTRPMFQFQADILDLSKFKESNAGHRYVLGVIDVFSRRAYARKLKTKSAVEVAKNMQHILDKIPSVKVLQTDLGREFWNKTLQSYLKKRDIDVWLSEDRDTKAAIIERWFKTLRGKILKVFTYKGGEQKWTIYLDKIVTNYNGSVHRSIGVAPDDVNSQNVHAIRRKLYPKKQPKTRKLSLLKAGDLIRVNRKKDSFEKNRWTNTKEVFIVAKRINRSPNPIYKISQMDGEVVEGTFYRENLVKIYQKK